ncbi:MAG: hypothetical protein H7Y88_09965 [Phycisphaerales bacterium]|nr:hypothetical protein [Phycisphaerales bacterium]
MDGKSFLSISDRYGRRLRGTGAAVFYILTGAGFWYWQMNWPVIGTPLPAGAGKAHAWHALTPAAFMGFFAACFGIGMLCNSAGKALKSLGLGGLTLLKKNGYLTDEQFQIAKIVLLREPSLFLVQQFLRSASRVKPTGVHPKCIDLLRKYAEELVKGI